MYGDKTLKSIHMLMDEVSREVDNYKIVNVRNIWFTESF